MMLYTCNPKQAEGAFGAPPRCSLSFFNPFFGIFSTLPSIQTIKVIGLILFLWAGHDKFSYEHAFQPYTYSL